MTERIEGLNIGLDLDHLALERGLTGVKDRLKTVNSEMRKNMSAFDRGDRSIGKYETRLQGLNKKLDVQKKVTEETYKEYQKMVDEHGEGSKEAEKAERAYNNQAAALNNLERYVQQTTDELEEMRKEQAFQESGWGRLTNNLTQFSDRMDRMGDTLTGFGRTMSMQVTAPIVAAGGLALGAADKMEQAYRDIRVGTGATGEALDELEQSFDQVFASVPDGADQVAGALANLNTFTGASGRVLEGLTERILDVSRLLKEDATQNSQAFGEALKQWQLPAEQGADVLDYMYTLTQDYGVGLSELSGQLTNYGSVLNNAGFEMNEAAHFMASLESNGIAVSRIMPGLNKAFRNWASEGKDSREELEKIVETIAETEDKQKALSLATEVFGAEGAQRLMTAIRNRAIPAFEELGEGAQEAKGSIETTAEETKTMGEEFAEIRNKAIQGLKPAGDILLNVARDHLPPLIDGVTNLAEWFDNLDTSTQKTILSTAGFVAAIGPASLVLGTTFKAVSTLTGGMAALSGIIGRVGGAGLLARIAGFGLGGPVGLAIGGLTALGGVIYALTRDTKDLNEVNFEKVKQMNDEVQSVDELISRFENLRKQNKLTTDEMLEYMDVLAELEQTSSPQKIEELTKKKEDLLKKSGFTNDEMNEFLKLNDQVIEKAPDTAKAISSEGEAYVKNLDALRNLNAEKRRELAIESRSELLKALENENKLLEEKDRLISEIEEIDIRLNGLYDERIEAKKKVNKEEEVLKRLQNELNILEKDGVEIGSEKWLQKKEEIRQQEINLSYVEAEKSGIDNTINQLEEKYSKNQKNLDSTREQLRELDNLKYEYEQIVLAQAGINSEKGKGLQTIDEEIKKLKDQKRELDDQLNTNTLDRSQHSQKVSEINNQINKLKGAKSQLKQMNDLAGKTIYDKRIRLSLSPSLTYLNRQIASDVTKRVNVRVANPGYQMLAYADGTNHHPGGPAIVGEEGWELARYKNKWTALPFGIFDLPRGTQVFPHDESKQLAANAIPAYANGARPPSEFMKLLAISGRQNQSSNHTSPNNDLMKIMVDKLSEQVQDTKQIVSLLAQLLMKDTSVELDGRLVSKLLEPYISEEQGRNQYRREQFS